MNLKEIYIQKLKNIPYPPRKKQIFNSNEQNFSDQTNTTHNAYRSSPFLVIGLSFLYLQTVLCLFSNCPITGRFVTSSCVLTVPKQICPFQLLGGKNITNTCVGLPSILINQHQKLYNQHNLESYLPL